MGFLGHNQPWPPGAAWSGKARLMAGLRLGLKWAHSFSKSLLTLLLVTIFLSQFMKSKLKARLPPRPRPATKCRLLGSGPPWALASLSLLSAPALCLSSNSPGLRPPAATTHLPFRFQLRRASHTWTTDPFEVERGFLESGPRD